MNKIKRFHSPEFKIKIKVEKQEYPNHRLNIIYKLPICYPKKRGGVNLEMNKIKSKSNQRSELQTKFFYPQVALTN
ncbi:MAG: hypothetical protein AB1465_07040 [Patescibacteria group bacterium]